MKVQLEKTFTMPASADIAWALLQDIEGVAGCMPGARITERIDPQHYKGTVALKFGPANMSFRGQVEVLGLEPASRTLRLAGKGTDSTGGSGASMDLTARVDAIDAVSCNLVGASEVSVSGRAAAFGGRMMESVADQLLKQFADNFAVKVKTLQAQTAARPPPTPGGEPAAADATAPGPEPARPLNGLALLWAAVKDWLRSLFERRAQ
jgi:carbon monoxide dehydrogenase subunit G